MPGVTITDDGLRVHATEASEQHRDVSVLVGVPEHPQVPPGKPDGEVDTRP